MPGGIATFSRGRGTLAGTTYIDVLPDMSKFGPRLRTEVAGLLRSVGTLKAQGLEQSLGGIGTALTRTGGLLTRNLTVPIAGAGAATFALNAGFEQVLSRMVGLAGVGRDELGGIRDFLLDLAGETGRGPTQLAEALYLIRSAGLEGQQALDLVEIAAKASAAGMGETQTIASALTSTLNAYANTGLSAAEAADILTAAVRDGAAEADEFAGVIGTVVPLAAQLGVGFDQVAASIAAMTKVGIGTDTAAVNINAVFSALLRASKVGSQADKALRSVGLSADQLRADLARPGGILRVFEQIEQAFGGDEAQLQLVFPEIRGLRGFSALIAQNRDEVNQVFENAANSAGALNEAFAAVADDGAFKAQQAIAEAQVAAVKFGGAVAPVGKQLLDFAGNAADAFGSIPTPIKTGAVAIGGLAAALGPASFLVGNLVKGAGLLTAAFKGSATQMSSFRLGLKGIETGFGGASANRLGVFAKNLGPVGLTGALGGATVALTLGAVALDRWKERKEAAKRETLEFIEAIRADSGEVGENTRQSIRNRLEKDGLADDLAKLNGHLRSGRDAFDVYVDAANGSIPAQQELRQAILDSNQAGIDWGESSAELVRRISEDWVKYGGTIGDAEQRVGKDTQGLRVEHNSLSAELDKVFGKVDEGKDSWNALSGASRTYADVQRAVAAAQAKVFDLRSSGKFGTDELAKAEADLAALQAEQTRITQDNTGATNANTDARKGQLTTIEQLVDSNRFLSQLADEIAASEDAVADAERELADARADAVGAGAQSRAAAERERDALAGLADAHQSVADAQERVLDARKELVDFESGTSAQIRALELDQLQSRTVTSPEEARQKQIDLLKFDQSAGEERERLHDAVAEAERGVVDATDRVSDAQRQVAAAAAERRRVQVEAAQRVEEAERNLRSAVDATMQKIAELGTEGADLLAPWLAALQRITETLAPGSPLRTNLEGFIAQALLLVPPGPVEATEPRKYGQGGQKFFSVGGNVDDGYFVVGEQGPELGRKRGSDVEIFSNRDSRRMLNDQPASKTVRVDARQTNIIHGNVGADELHELEVQNRKLGMKVALAGRRS